MNSSQKKTLLKLARQVIMNSLNKEKKQFEIPEDEIFHKTTGAFVTLHKNGNLRGCIGYIIGYRRLWDTISEMSEAAAFGDPRFSPVTQDEIDDIDIEISILSELIRVKNIDEVIIGRDGLFMKNGFYSGLLLPQVATEWGWDKNTFLKETCRKAGMSSNCWQDPKTEIYRFSAEIFSEKELLS